MSGEYWGRPDGQQPSGQNPADNTNYPTPQPQESANTDQPTSEASAQGWTTPGSGYGTPAQPGQPAQPSTPSYGTPTTSYGGPSYGAPTTGYGSTDNGQPTPSSPTGYGADSATPTPGHGSAPGYGMTSGYGTSASTPQSGYGTDASSSQPGHGTSTPPSSSYGTDTSATTPQSPGYGNTDYGTGPTGSTGSPLDLGAQSSYPSSTDPQAQSYGATQSGYTTPADGSYAGGGYDSSTSGYGATTDYSSAGQGYTGYTQTPQDQYASTGNYGYTTPNYGAVLTGPVAPNGQPLASFGKRALSYLIDFLAPSFVAGVIGGIIGGVIEGISGSAGSDTNVGGTIQSLLFFAWFLYNTVYLGGTTGQSWGRKVAKTRLLSEGTGQPLGMGMAFLRQLAHIIDTVICLAGWLFPLWDAKRQTIADKIVGSLVVDESMGTPGYTAPQQPGQAPQQPGQSGQPYSY